MKKIENVYNEHGITLLNVKIEHIYGEYCLETFQQYQKDELINCFNKRTSIINKICKDLEPFNIEMSVTMYNNKIEFNISTKDINKETLKQEQTTTVHFFQSGEVIVSTPKKFEYKFEGLKNEVDTFIQEKKIKTAQNKVEEIFNSYGREPEKLKLLQGKNPTQKKGLKF